MYSKIINISQNGNLQMKILFTTPILEHPPAGGPQLRIENSIKALNKISELHLISRISREAIGGNEAEKFYKSICYTFSYTPVAESFSNEILHRVIKFRFNVKIESMNRFINIPFKLFGRIRNLVNKKSEEKVLAEDVEFIKKYVRKNKIDVIWFGYGNISYKLMKLLKKDLPEIKMVCDTDSVWSRFVLRELDVESDPDRREKIKDEGYNKELEETKWVELMDVTTAVSEVDADYYKTITSDKSRIHIFSNVIDIGMYKKSYFQPEDFKKPCIYLAGSFGHDNSPMDRAAMWMLEEIYPIVKKNIPEISFYIIGRNSERLRDQVCDDSVKVIGKVDSVLPYLCNADVSVVPLKFESGTRFKILEAGACGIPIVSTTLGAEGIPVINNNDILIADTPEDFANAIIRLINNEQLTQKLAFNCKKLIEEKYSVEYLAKEGQKIIEYLSAK